MHACWRSISAHSRVMEATQDELGVREIGPEISESLASFFTEARNQGEVIERLVAGGLTVRSPPVAKPVQAVDPDRQNLRVYRWPCCLAVAIRPKNWSNGRRTSVVECE